jgi:hypothetical protein
METLRDGEPRGIDFDEVRQNSRQTLNMQLAHIVVKDAAFFDTGRHSASQMQGHLYPNRLVHRDFKQIRMEHIPFDRIDLEIAQ